MFFLEGWASGRLPDMRRAIELLREQSVLWLDGPAAANGSNRPVPVGKMHQEHVSQRLDDQIATKLKGCNSGVTVTRTARTKQIPFG